MEFRKSFVVAALFTVVSFAAITAVSAGDASKEPGSGPNPYTDCGVGAALFPETHWAAVSSNIIWDLGATALTSATASPQTCAAKRVKAALFIGTTYDELAEETAAGQGDHLTAVLDLFDCSAAHHADAIAEVRNAMGREVATPDFADLSRLQKSAKYYSIMESAVTHRCSA